MMPVEHAVQSLDTYVVKMGRWKDFYQQSLPWCDLASERMTPVRVLR